MRGNLEVWSHFDDSDVNSCQDAFVAHALQFGEVSDQFIHDKLTSAGIDMAQFEIRCVDGKQLDDKVINQRRVCWLTSPHFQAAELAKVAAKAQAAANVLTLAAEKAAKKVQKEAAGAAARALVVRLHTMECF